VTDKAQAAARRAVRRAHADFERAQDKADQLREVRRKSFEEARAAGLSTRDIAEETGIHFTRVARILQSKP
jgi:DNA-directed RNA polymerase specialized sigma24 family protein